MKKFYLTLFLFFLIVVTVISLSSCDNKHDDPDFPVYATYHVSFDENSYEGPDQMRKDINAWIKSNSITFDEFVAHSQKDSIDYLKADSIAITVYDEQVKEFKKLVAISIFKLFLKEYGDDRKASVSYTASIIRVQGGNPVLSTQIVEMKFP